jgi:threonine dehydratase
MTVRAPLEDFFRAHQLIGEFCPPTPISALESLGRRSQIRLHGKHENRTPIRSFKLRGALYTLSLLTQEERSAGVITSSTGNHGMGIAYAARAFSAPATVVMPENAARVKRERIKQLGAEVIRAGKTLTEAELLAQERARATGSRFIEDGNDLGLMVGAGTIAIEILLARPETEALIVPVGGGNLIAGIAMCAKSIKPTIEVVGIQSEEAPSVTRSFQAGHSVEAPSTTFAGGLATEHPGELALEVILGLVDDMLTVPDAAIRAATVTALTELGEVLEGSGAVGIAGVLAFAPRWRDRTTVVVLTGGNADGAELATSLRESETSLAVTP